MLPGLTVRPLTLDDVPAWSRLLGRAAVVDRPRVVDPESLLRTQLGADGVSLPDHTVAGLDVDGELRAVGVVHLRLGDVEHLRLVFDGVVDPAWRGRGVGRALLAWAGDVARSRAARRRAELGADVPAALQVWSGNHREDLARLCRAGGLEVRRYFSSMQRDVVTVPEVTVPEGYRLVRYDEHGGVGLREVHNEVFADHWGSQPVTASDWEGTVTGHPEFRGSWSFVVLHGAEIVAYAVVFAHRLDPLGSEFDAAELGDLGVRRDHRGHGLAGLLLAAVARRAHEARLRAVRLDVDSENPSGAVGLYERAGYVRVHGDVLHALPV